ncbi:demethylmenaquinone methyltransferase [Staphylospora marina]|uniref:demethylmenaquinone methyltransferase n=1 Tax=Staphylospora marina TaxID=2490858 RepID=UPI000F5BFACC|nr:demethylmenaquinone methyltransferase [Staphylospora marina]
MSREQHRPKAGHVHQVFEKIARDYDRVNDIISFTLHKRWRAYTIKRMHVKPGDTAIDVCTGTGDWAIALAKTSGTGRIVGLDFSGNMLAVAREKLEREGLGDRLELVQGDAMSLPFPDNSFDHATIGFALRNVPDLVQVLKEMKRVVKPGGQVVSLEMSKPSWGPFKAVFYLYFEKILPWIGKIFTGYYEQYRWLPESLVHFPDYRELARIMREEVGLEDVRVKTFVGGVTALHIGRKPVSEQEG